ncbi:MAG TPA: Crp/Fnr family transcriptional regulator [Solirubrobacteraceae bacterium]|nr:Crp/Fnr family transcriptional regulator [Solirubrobacteraceae bacterium]
MRVWTVDDPMQKAWSVSFLARLPPSAQEQLMATAHQQELVAGQNVYRELRQPRFSFLALVISGLLRQFVTSPQGRQIVTRYWRPGEVPGLTSAVGPVAPTGIDAIRQGLMLRLDPVTLERLGRTDVQVAWVIAEELANRLVVAANFRIPNVFGNVKVRVAWHLLERADDQRGQLVARVTQQELADSVGSVREVVARVLLSMSQCGLIAREGPLIVIPDRERLELVLQSFDD